MALTLCVGFVVDDAIVMLENIVRHMEMGEKPMDAAVERFPGSGIHHSFHDPLVGRRLHPCSVHGGDHGRAVSRNLPSPSV